MKRIQCWVSDSEYERVGAVRNKLGIKSDYELLQTLVRGFLVAHEVASLKDLSSEIDDVFNDLITHDHNGLEPKGEQFLRRI